MPFATGSSPASAPTTVSAARHPLGRLLIDGDRIPTASNSDSVHFTDAGCRVMAERGGNASPTACSLPSSAEDRGTRPVGSSPAGLSGQWAMDNASATTAAFAAAHRHKRAFLPEDRRRGEPSVRGAVRRGSVSSRGRAEARRRTRDAQPGWAHALAQLAGTGTNCKMAAMRRARHGETDRVDRSRAGRADLQRLWPMR